MTVSVESASSTGDSMTEFSWSPKAAFHSGWNRISGLSLSEGQLTIDPSKYFFRCEEPSWTYIPWEVVREHWFEIRETRTLALEQASLQFVASHGKTTSDPSMVLANAEDVYSYLYDRDRLAGYDDLSEVSAADLRVLRESSILCALNKVDLAGHITITGPAWYFAQCARVVFDLDRASEMRVDELFHGGFFNGSRLVDQVRAHTALGGKLVHGCQGTGNGSGGCVVAYGTDVQAMQSELVALRKTVLRTFGISEV